MAACEPFIFDSHVLTRITIFHYIRTQRFTPHSPSWQTMKMELERQQFGKFPPDYVTSHTRKEALVTNFHYSAGKENVQKNFVLIPQNNIRVLTLSNFILPLTWSYHKGC